LISKSPQMKKFKLQSDSTNTLVKENIIELIHWVYKMAFECQKIAGKVAKKHI